MLRENRGAEREVGFRLDSELPDELVWGAAGEADPAAVDAVEVMGNADADDVPGVVGAALGDGDDVVAVAGEATAARHLAVLVAPASLLLGRAALLHRRSPDL